MKPILRILAFASLFSACKKEEVDALPKATQEGKNTAGFLLDGQPWLPKASSTATIAPVRASRYQTSRGRGLSIVLSRTEQGNTDALGIDIPDIGKMRIFHLDQHVDFSVGSLNPAYALYAIHQPNPGRRFLTGPTAKGIITLTRFDTLARVVSGTFDLTVREDAGLDSLRLTQGRFDLTF